MCIGFGVNKWFIKEVTVHIPDDSTKAEQICKRRILQFLRGIQD